MKKIIAIVAAVLALSVSVSAQRYNGYNGYSSHRHSYDAPQSLNHVHMAYSPLTAKLYNKGGKTTFPMIGLSVGAGQILPITATLPLLLEYGVDAQYSFMMKKNENRNMMSFNAPVSVMYQVGMPGAGVAILPYAGLDFGYNLFGSQKVLGERVGYFSDLDFSRFMVGAHLGVKLLISSVYFGLEYQGCINELATDLKYTQAQFSVGVLF